LKRMGVLDVGGTTGDTFAIFIPRLAAAEQMAQKIKDSREAEYALVFVSNRLLWRALPVTNLLITTSDT
jgi:hypothetical protein